MKIKYSYIVFLFISFSLMLISSCEKEEDIQSKLNKLEGKGYFPMQVGNYWKFQDSPKISIETTEIIDGKEYFRFIHQHHFKHPDTAYYRKTVDGKIYSLVKGDDDILLYDLSAKVGKSWTKVRTYNDSTYVELKTKNDTVEINNFIFQNCYKYFSDSYNPIIIDDASITWFAPNIGKIQITGGIGTKKLEEVQIDGVKIKF